MKNLAELVNLGYIFLMDVPNPEPIIPPGIGEKILEVLGMAKWAAIVMVVFGFTYIGGVMWYENNVGQANDVAKRFMYVALGAIIIGSSSALTAFLTGA